MPQPAKPSISRLRRPAVYGGWMVFGAMLAIPIIFAGCGGPPPLPRPLQAIQDENHSIERPGERNAAATGVGCALTASDAVTNAEKTAHFNLRSMMGPGKYDVQFRVLREVPDSALICYEVRATLL